MKFHPDILAAHAQFGGDLELMQRLYDEGTVDVPRYLADQAKPTQSAWAKKHGVAAAYVSDVINGRREPGKAILDALGLERVVTYRRVKEESE